MGKFNYQVKRGKVSGSFNIYQAKNGKIYISMGNSHTFLSYEQVQELCVDVYQLTDFDLDLYKSAYQINA